MTTKLSNPYYNALCIFRFLEHFTNNGIDQQSYDHGRFARFREYLASKAYRPESGGYLQARQVSSKEEFVAACASRRMPVVFKGGASGWPCSEKWNFEFFRNNCSRTEVFNISDHITENGSVRGKTNLGDIIRAFGNGGKNGGQYARFVPIIHTFPEILRDLDMDMCTEVIGKRKKGVKLWGSKEKGVAIRSHLFLGETGTKTNTHCELTSNLFVNVVGRKEWIVCPPSYLFALPGDQEPGCIWEPLPL